MGPALRAPMAYSHLGDLGSLPRGCRPRRRERRTWTDIRGHRRETDRCCRPGPPQRCRQHDQQRGCDGIFRPHWWTHIRNSPDHLAAHVRKDRIIEWFPAQAFEHGLALAESCCKLTAIRTGLEVPLHGGHLSIGQVILDKQSDSFLKLSAVHNRLLDCRSTNFRIFTRALEMWQRTVTSLVPKMRATSFVAIPSRSRNTRAARSRSESVSRAS